MIEGGSDTNLKYVFIKSLVPGSPAFNCAQLKPGDQLVMVGKECLIGMTQQAAKRAIEQAPESVEIVVQRKKSQKQSPKSSAVDIYVSELSTPDQRQSPQPLPRSESYMKSRTLSHSGEIHMPMIGLASIHDQSLTKSLSLSTSWNMGRCVWCDGGGGRGGVEDDVCMCMWTDRPGVVCVHVCMCATCDSVVCTWEGGSGRWCMHVHVCVTCDSVLCACD